MQKNKIQKRTQARKNAEAQKALKKAQRQVSGNIAPSNGKKGKSSVPQSKAKKK